MDDIKLNDIADDLLILNKITIDRLFQLDNCADCIALYIFYYKTAKWQKTDTVKANDQYVKKSLKWGISKIQKTKQTLKEHGLIDIVQRRKDGKIEGWFIKVSYLVSERKADEIKIKVQDINNTQNNQVVQESNNTQNEQVENSTCGNEETNALKENIKCLKKEIEMLKNNNIGENNNTPEAEKPERSEKRERFKAPSVEEVQEYCIERGNNIDAQHFVDYYSARGWMLGKNHIKDWKACVRTWERNDSFKPQKPVQPENVTTDKIDYSLPQEFLDILNK